MPDVLQLSAATKRSKQNLLFFFWGCVTNEYPLVAFSRKTAEYPGTRHCARGLPFRVGNERYEIPEAVVMGG